MIYNILTWLTIQSKPYDTNPMITIIIFIMSQIEMDRSIPSSYVHANNFLLHSKPHAQKHEEDEK